MTEQTPYGELALPLADNDEDNVDITEVKTFADCVLYCAGIPELVKEYNRIFDCNLGASLSMSALERMIDEATGYDQVVELRENDDCSKFVAFVYECTWCRLPDNCFEYAPSQ